MDGRPLVETRFLVLRLTPYSDTSVIAAGISPDRGQLHFLLRGGRRLGPKQFPAVDLFRVLRVVYQDRPVELHRPVSAELEADYGALARDYGAFRAAEWLARFALRNVLSGVRHEAFFEALCVGLSRLAAPRPADRGANLADCVTVGAVVTYLHEGGWLAVPGNDDRAGRQCRTLLDMAAGRQPPPALSAETWRALRQWVLNAARAADCDLPPDA